ncbi:hypothetical protein Tco_0850738 [Tanacetum coccineum]
MSNHNRIYIAPSHIKKIFRNMRRVGKGFSGRETPLFQTVVVQDQAEMGEGSANPTDPHYTPTFIQPSTSQPQKKQKPRKPKRKDTQIPQSSGPTKHVADEAVYKELDDSLVRAATTASSLEAEQDSGDTIAQTRFENVSKISNDLLLARGNTLRSGKDSLKLKELMELCTNLQTRVLDLEKTKITQAEEIVSLRRRVEKLEHKKRSRTHRLKRLYKVGLTARVESSRDEESLALDALKSVKPKVKSNVVEEPSILVSAASTKVSAATTTTTATIPTPRKGICKSSGQRQRNIGRRTCEAKEERSNQLDEEIASKLQGEFDEEERLAREKDESNVALTEEWDDIQAKVDVDYQLAQRLQAEEQEQFITEQKATLFKELLGKEENTLQLKEQKRRGTNHQPKLNKEKHMYLPEEYRRKEAQRLEE